MAAVTAANEAATAAQTAADDAQTAADDAKAAAANRATIQTVDSSYMSAHAAQTAAYAAAGNAKDAADSATAAAAAEGVTAAIEARIAAETGQADAEDDLADANAALAEAKTRAMAEVNIVKKTKTVGTTSITINNQTVDDATNGQQTGLITSMKLTDTGGGTTPGRTHVLGVPTATPPTKAVGVHPIVENRAVDIGFTYDSAADDARLTLVTSYLSSQTVSVFQDQAQAHAGQAANTVMLQRGDAMVPVPIHPASGTYLNVEGAEGGLITDVDIVGALTKPTQLYYYQTLELDNANTVDRDESKKFLRRTATTPGLGGTTTYDYIEVDVVNGVKLPAKADFVHLHYGLWNALTPASKAGAQITPDKVADLGIGFATAQGTGEGMTPADDMPQLGDATYSGNWIANIQAAHPSGTGGIGRMDGTAKIDANFTKASVTVGLTGLADLSGAISGNGFSGTMATVAVNPVGQLGTTTKAGDFTGEFNGGFFGSKASEAGGVFDFGSTDNKLGAFTGSFGGAQTPDNKID